MTGWVVIWVLGVMTVLAVWANHRYCWTRGWLYSWRRSRHAIELTQAEPVPAPEYGSMILAEEQAFWPAPLELVHEPDPWLTRLPTRAEREHLLAELDPDTLNGKLEAQRARWAAESKPLLLLPMGDPASAPGPVSLPGEEGAAPINPPSAAALPGAGDESEPSGAPAPPAPGPFDPMRPGVAELDAMGDSPGFAFGIMLPVEVDLGPRALAVLERYERRRQERWALA